MNRLFFGVFMIFSLSLISSCSKKTNLFKSSGKMENFTPVTADFDFLSAKAKIIIEEESGKLTRGDRKSVV